MKILTTALIASIALATPIWAEDYNFDGFSRVSAAAGVTVIVTAGDDFSVQGRAIRGKIKRLRIRQSGDTLEISRKSGWGLINVFKNDKFEVTVTMPEIEAADTSSGSTMTVDANDQDGFWASSSSGSTLEILNIGGGSVELDVSSGATLSASGACNELSAEASSGASLSARNLDCDTGIVDASSGASLSVSVSNSVEGEASSGSSVVISGRPATTQIDTTSGASVSNRS